MYVNTYTFETFNFEIKYIHNKIFALVIDNYIVLIIATTQIVGIFNKN